MDHYGVIEDDALLGFCVVANVARETAQGEGGLDIRRGTKHFAGGAKVWVLPAHWGDGGEKVIVAGRHRGRSGPYIRMVLPRRHLENFRVRGVYSPALLRALTKPLGNRRVVLWETRDEAEQAAEGWNAHRLDAFSDDHRWLGGVSDPPPLDLCHGGRTYHLAHFNARRAIYSSLHPPAEAVP